MTQPSVIDWEKVERDYRAGIMSLREIGEANGCSHVAVSKKAKAEAWPRDLKAKIQAKADALVNRAQVNAGVNAVREAETVEAGAALIASVRLGHRQDIVRARSLAMKLLAEIEAQTDGGDLLEQLESAVSGSDSDSVSKVFQRVTSTSGRVDNAKKLAEAMKVLIGLEREAYSLDSTPLPPPAAPVPFDYSILSPAALRELRQAAANASTDQP